MSQRYEFSVVGPSVERCIEKALANGYAVTIRNATGEGKFRVGLKKEGEVEAFYAYHQDVFQAALRAACKNSGVV